MSNIMFMLDSHLRPEQQRALQTVQTVSAELGGGLFLTGGALRDLFGGFPIRDLDFTVEGDALQLARAIADRELAILLSVDELRGRADLLFPGQATVEISMAREETYPKPGGKPQIKPATIYEDLRRRDFTMNAMALSLSRASRGLLLDPVNGRSDLDLHHLRAVSNYGFYDDPIRLLRLIRYRARFGYSVDERTQRQYQNAREAGMAEKISARGLADELRQIAHEQQPFEVFRILDEEGLAVSFSPGLTGAKLNAIGFQKLVKARQMLPYGTDLPTDELALLLTTLAETLSPKERSALTEQVALTEEEIDRWHKLPARAKKLEKELAAASISRPSKLYQLVNKWTGEHLLYILAHSRERIVLDRLRNYLQKYLPLAQEVTDADVAATGVEPGTPAFRKRREQMITAKLNTRQKKPAELVEHAAM